MKICDPNEFEFTFKGIAPNRRKVQIIFDNVKGRSGFVYLKRYAEDDSYFAPYLAYEIGKKVGINVTEAEVAVVPIHINPDKYSYRDSFFEASIVYVDQLSFGKIPLKSDIFSYVPQKVVLEDYLMNKAGASEEIMQNKSDRDWKKKIEDYIDSNIYYLITRGHKPREEYSKTEIDEIKQELIDRLLFSIRIGTRGDFEISLENNRNAQLTKYNIANDNMFCLGVREEWIEAQLSKTDEEFRKILDREYALQYCLKSGIVHPSCQDVIKYIYEKYPEQAQKSYKKLSSFTEKDFEEELKKCTHMSEIHKKFALRAFGMRYQEFEEVNQAYVRRPSIEK